mgnify:CR=1 FL=1
MKGRIVADVIFATPQYPSEAEDQMTAILHSTPIPTGNVQLRGTVRSFIEIVRDGTVIVTEGNTLVLVDRTDDDSKMSQFLESIGVRMDPGFNFDT